MVKKWIGGAVADLIPGKPPAKDVAMAKPRNAQGAWMAQGCKQGSSWVKKEVNQAAKIYRMVLLETNQRIMSQSK
jgi:hypothetical protein